MPQAARALLVAGLLLGGCSRERLGLGQPAHGVLRRGQAGPSWFAGVRRFALDVGDATGLSDLTFDDQQHFWTVPERQRLLIRLNLDAAVPGTDATPLPLMGIPEGTDTEGLTHLGGDDFAVATETQVRNRDSDSIYFVRLEGGAAQVRGRLSFPYGLWHMRARANNGLEGICAARQHLVVAAETVQRDAAGRRFAAVGTYDRRAERWRPFGIYLSSYIGKLSALACRAQGTTDIEVLAIERHLGVSRLLRFVLPTAATPPGPPQMLQPEMVLDLGKVIDAVPNLEGVTFGPGGDLYLLSDNDFGIVTGPTQAVVIPAAALGEAGPAN